MTSNLKYKLYKHWKVFIKKKICENFSFKFPIFDPRPIEKNRLFDRNFGNGGQLGYFF